MPASANRLPRWRGFNLLEKFTADNSSKSITFEEANPRYREDDFRWISDWGFDFVRLPTSYHCWSSPEDPFAMDERVLEHIDEAVEFGVRYGIHVSLNLHRAPGYCVNPPAEPRDLWTDQDALDACAFQWEAFARRYAGIGSEHLSFDLINEPPRPGPDFDRGDHERVVRALVKAIRQEDPDRLVVADGLAHGTIPVPELADLGIGQSCRGYAPMGISHYQATWVNGESFPDPRWPGGWHFDEEWSRGDLESMYDEWAVLIDQGIGVHCGECGCYNRTPHEVFLAWFADVLEVLAEREIGFSLWNFRGTFGVLDSGRSDVSYEEWNGHQLDRKLLDLLQAH